MTVQQARTDTFKAWKGTMIAGGITTIVLGLVLLIWPEQTLLVFASLLGIGLILVGIARLANAATDRVRAGKSRLWRALLGLIYIIAGIVVLANLNGTLRFLVWAVGVIWVITGIVEIISALARGRGHASASGWSSGDRAISIVIGVLNLAFGVVVLVWPGPTVVFLVWISGLWLIALGVLQIIFAFMAGRMFKGDDDPAYHVIEEQT
jgi:uncharacterized membrane protein HdeD (DUF308 family)